MKAITFRYGILKSLDGILVIILEEPFVLEVEGPMGTCRGLRGGGLVLSRTGLLSELKKSRFLE